MTTRKPPTLQLALLVALAAVVTLGVPQLMACDSSRAAASAPEANTGGAGDRRAEARPDGHVTTQASSATAQAAAPRRPTPDVPVAVAPPLAPSFSAPTRGPSGSVATGLSVRRLVVAHDVVDREPVVRESTFEAGRDRVFAFVEARNAGADAGAVHIYFEGPTGQRVGDIGLDVPGAQRRWRTWGYSRNVSTPGTWEAVVVDDDGHVLAREAFEVR